MVAAVLWYENQGTGLGERLIDAVDKALSIISNSALIYPIKRKGCRAAGVKKFPFLIYYKLLPSSIVVITVLHTSRNPDTWIHTVS